MLEICDPAVREMLDGWGVEPVREILRVSLYYPDDSTIPPAARGGCCCGCGVQLTAVNWSVTAAPPHRVIYSLYDTVVS